MRPAKQLLLASKHFASECRWKSWWHLWSTLAIYGTLLVSAAIGLPLVIRLAASILAGLVHIRLFILYHDFQHGAILGRSRLATSLMGLFGLYSLSPTSFWNRSHDHHHRNTAQIFGTDLGSYPIMTTEAFAQASWWQRRLYVLARHPLTMATGYVTVFLYGMCLLPLFQRARSHFDGALAIILHVGLLTGLTLTLGIDAALLAIVLPLWISSTLGAYLFYAQHNYPGVKLRNRESWSYVDAALHSSSYIKMSPIMHWFTGNIGYHHVHHLNARIPFYRLPEAMAGIRELQTPGTTSLRPRDVLECLRLKLWDEDRDCLVPFEKH
jgi:omega-6 fatty acid desaturase (delta-12 desaturase)